MGNIGRLYGHANLKRGILGSFSNPRDVSKTTDITESGKLDRSDRSDWNKAYEPTFFPMAGLRYDENFGFDTNDEPCFHKNGNLFEMNFKVESDIFRGPVDLLLYLVRRHEVEVSKIALSKIADEYFQYLDVLKEISIDSVGDFIEVASILVELKARAVLPKNEIEKAIETEEVHDPRENLVHRLLLYKKYRDASVLLQEQATRWHDQFPRMADDLPVQKVDPASQPIKEVELWDLVSAFGRVLRDNRPVPQENITYDETPIHVYMQRIHARIVRQRSVSFSELFEAGMHKSAMVGIFLAVLELTRHHNVVAQQDELHSEILIVPNEGFQEALDVSNIDDYNPHAKQFESGDPGSLVN